MRKIAKALLGCFLAVSFVMPIYAEEWLDATHLFEEETKWLADNHSKETRSEFEFRTKGVLQYADQKPPQVGEEVTFKTFNILEKKHEPQVGVLKKIGKHCYVYLQKGKKVSDSAIEKIVNTFDEKIYPTDTETFGDEWSPGIDGDPKITLFLLDIQDGFGVEGRKSFTAGYFYAGDEYSREKNPSSNEREMLYLDIHPTDPTKENFYSVLAHEFQHMIHWHHDPKELTWVNESMSQLASFLNGFGHPNQVLSFIKNTDNSMTAWSPENMVANYGQVYLFAYYMTMHLGDTAKKRATLIKTIVSEKSQGANGIEDALKRIKCKESCAEVFRNFCVTNFVNDASLDAGTYAYDKSLAKLKLALMKDHKSPPFSGKGTVKCWSARAVRFDMSGCEGDIKVSFMGQTQVAENKYRNYFDVAAILLNGKSKVKPMIHWLSMAENKAEQKLSIPAGAHDSLILVICNRGPEGKAEVGFARSVPPAEFAYSVAVNKKGSLARVIAKANRRVSRRTMRSMVENISGGFGKLEEMTPELSGESVDGQGLDNVYSAELDRMEMEETLLVDSIHAGVLKNDLVMLQEFYDIYNASSPEGKTNLKGLKNKIEDMVRFEIMQNQRDDLKGFLE